MLNDTLFRVPRQPGVQTLQQRGEKGARELSTRRIQLAAGSSLSLSVPGEESVLVVQRGSASLRVGGQTWQATRADVFSERASALYLPPGDTAEIVVAVYFEAVM